MTMCALSTAPGRAGIAIVRISGPAAYGALQALCGGKVPASRTAALRKLRDPRTGEVLDRGLALWFPGPAPTMAMTGICEFLLAACILMLAFSVSARRRG